VPKKSSAFRADADPLLLTLRARNRSTDPKMLTATGSAGPPSLSSTVTEQVHVLERGRSRASPPDARNPTMLSPRNVISRVGRIEAGDDVEQRALARPVRPDHAEDLARIDMHVEPSERRESAELLAA
jgi:hypothetical protein